MGLHTCTAVARSLCVSWAFLFLFGASASEGLAFLDVLPTLYIAVLYLVKLAAVVDKSIHSFIHDAKHSAVSLSLLDFWGGGVKSEVKGCV